MHTFFEVLEMLGIVSFAVSGAMVAIDKQTDAFGVLFLAVTTTFGGGMTRDLLIGNIPPLFFSNGVGILVCLSVALTVFLLAAVFKKHYIAKEKLIYTVNNVFDAIGLGVFAVMGAQIALESPDAVVSHPACAIFCGMISTIGGSIIRDVLLRDIPFIFCKRIYALAALTGASVYVLLVSVGADSVAAATVSVVTVFALRMMATAFKWNIPPAIRFDRCDTPSDHLSNK
ncbi:MAG: trimeric intracellular cation channel family protein [Clostridia bacterium]|nr:trimeric intracellular cation channel family protein [Clostridia bacterium]